MSEVLPVANVLWWDDRNMQVRCPFCDKKHRHGIWYSERYDEIYSTRVAHCPPVLQSSSHRYRFWFPFYFFKQKTAYEIDKENRRFLAIGIQQDSDDVTSLAEDLETDLNVNEGSEPS